jgi:hypothetical protein
MKARGIISVECVVITFAKVMLKTAESQYAIILKKNIVAIAVV